MRYRFPTINWYKDYTTTTLKADLISGLSVALILIPQSMAYARLAGLPAYYGLYAAFLPPIVSALFGSSHQLSTGPAAIISLMTSTALAPLAVAGTAQFVAYATLMALMVGVVQFSLGFFRMGTLVNLLSHPVIHGFTNAAALIIATSQVAKLFGVTVEREEHHYETLIEVYKAATHYTHLPTLYLGLLAIFIMLFMKRFFSKWPSVLVAVVITTVISWSSGLEQKIKSPIDNIYSEEVRDAIREYNALEHEITIVTHVDELPPNVGIKEIPPLKQTCFYCHKKGRYSERLRPKVGKAVEQGKIMAMIHNSDILKQHVRLLRKEGKKMRKQLRKFLLEGVKEKDRYSFYLLGKVPKGISSDGKIYKLDVRNQPFNLNQIVFSGGGGVVGNIPAGLPTIEIPYIDLKIIPHLLTSILIIALLGFMEAISIANAIASRTGQHLYPSKELIGQGLANIAGAITHGHPVSGSFARSAINYQYGGVTGLSNVFAGLFVALTLLFFTPILYHLPQSVLGAIIIVAVTGLINLKGIVILFRIQFYDGMIALITLVSTLYFAPHLDKGIMVGIALSLTLYLLRRIEPTITYLSKMADGSYRDSRRFHLAECKHILIIRFQGSLTFTNCSYLESQIHNKVEKMPHLNHIVIVSNAINELDTSGTDVLSALLDFLSQKGIKLYFSGLTQPILAVLKRTNLYEKIGEDHFCPNVRLTIPNIWEAAHEKSDEEHCPLQDQGIVDQLLESKHYS